MAKQTITIYDVAREAGVSMATVSRVVNGNTNVKPTTREKVLEVIERLDYRPNAVARGLASKRTRSVGVLIPDITNVYFSTLAQGINDIATMFKYNIILSSFDEQFGIEAVSSVLSRQVDGIIYIGNTLTDTVRRELSRSRIPVVLTDMIDAKEEFPSVNISLEGAFYEATQSLIASGKKKIAFVSTASFIGTEGDYRYRGFSKAIDENQNITKTQLVIDKLSYETGYRLLDKIINEKIDAIISIDDDVAVGIVNALVDNGHNVPDEVSVISANNSKMVTMARPQVSSIMPPIYDIGAVSMRLLTKLMDNDSEVDPIITLPYKIAYRETTKN